MCDVSTISSPNIDIQVQASQKTSDAAEGRLFSAAFAVYINAEEERKYKVRTAWITSIVLFFLLARNVLVSECFGSPFRSYTVHI